MFSYGLQISSPITCIILLVGFSPGLIVVVVVMEVTQAGANHHWTSSVLYFSQAQVALQAFQGSPRLHIP